MQVSLEKTQPTPAQKAKNILIRSFTKERQDSNPHNLEASYVLKYSPKYYKSLTIEIRPYSPLLSKIKKIKKLQKLEGRTGNSFQQILPQKLWSNPLSTKNEFPWGMVPSFYLALYFYSFLWFRTKSVNIDIPQNFLKNFCLFCIEKVLIFQGENGPLVLVLKHSQKLKISEIAILI